MKKYLYICLIIISSFTIISCAKSDDTSSSSSSGSDNSTTTSDNSTTSTTDTTAPTVSSVSTTADNQSSVAITDNITVTFSEAMDNSTVTANTDNTSCYGTLRVSSDNFSNCVRISSSPASSDNITFSLDPSDNLTRSATYLTRVTTGVKDAAGNAMSSQYDNSTGFTTSNLSAPSSFTATGAAGQVTLDWNAVSGASSYTVYWDNATGVSSTSTAITSISTDNYTHSGIDNGTVYYYKVAAVDSDNVTGYLSSEVSATTPLPAPDNLSASGANNTVTLTWNAVSGATSYTLYWDNASGIDSSDTAITSITNDNYTHSGLSNGATYYYKVAAVNATGTGTLSSVASALLSENIAGSETYSSHTYVLTSTTMNWNEAATAAAALGGYLVTLNTRAENTWLYDTFGNYGGTKRDLWIGAKDDVTEGSWYWDNGTTSGDGDVSDNISSGAKWPDGEKKWYGTVEPNDAGGEDCATIRGTLNSEKWNDLNCTGHDLYGIIEID